MHIAGGGGGGGGGGLACSQFLVYDWIFFILAGKEDNHTISKEFEIWPDRTKDCRVSCP